MYALYDVKKNTELFYRKQKHLPVIECGAKDAPFIRSEEHASDKLYSESLRARLIRSSLHGGIRTRLPGW